MTTTDAVAWIGAITGSLTLAMKVYPHRHRAIIRCRSVDWETVTLSVVLFAVLFLGPAAVGWFMADWMIGIRAAAEASR